MLRNVYIIGTVLLDQNTGGMWLQQKGLLSAGNMWQWCSIILNCHMVGWYTTRAMCGLTYHSRWAGLRHEDTAGKGQAIGWSDSLPWNFDFSVCNIHKEVIGMQKLASCFKIYLLDYQCRVKMLSACTVWFFSCFSSSFWIQIP
jgi:hypothetical protein